MKQYVGIVMAVVLWLGATEATLAQEPVNIFDSYFFKPGQEIVSCGSPYAVTRCNDGTCSTSSGSGTCSHHGGVSGPVIRTAAPTSTPVPAATSTPVPVPVAEVQPPQQPAVEPVVVPNSGAVLGEETSIWSVVVALGMVLGLVGAGGWSIR